MKIQVFILLGLMCCSAFSACVYLTTTATLSGTAYYVGSDATAKTCCVKAGSGGTDVTLGGAGTGTCTAKAILVANSKLWIVADITTGGLPLDTTSASYVAITPVGSLQTATIAIGQVETTALGTTVSGSYIGGLLGSTWSAITWDATTAPTVCTTSGSNTNMISIKATPAANNFFVDQTAAANTDMASPTYYGYDTVTKNFKGYSSDPCAKTFTSAATVTVNSVEYKFGTRDNECCVQAGTNSYCYNDVNLPGTCTALDIAANSATGDVWVALRISAAAADVMTAANGVSSVDYSDSLLTTGASSIIANSVLVGRITTATTDFGKFAYAAYVAPKTTAGAYTTFTFTDLRACTSNSVVYAQVEGTLGTSTWVDETGTAVTAATGTGAFLVINPATGDFQAFASTGRICAGASILSVASAILAFVGLVAL
jgi:hypothetical protein